VDQKRPRPLNWIGSSYRDYRRFPVPVQDEFGFALYRAQIGARHPVAKTMKGFGGSGVLELVGRHDGNTYRAVYTVRFAEEVYVLHAFQKKEIEEGCRDAEERDRSRQAAPPGGGAALLRPLWCAEARWARIVAE
jgi:phage-related protein